MSRRRVVFVTRRFWPLVGEAENALASLVAVLLEFDIEPTIVTPRWQKSWPQAFIFENVPVVRLAKPSASWWGDGSYSRRLVKWISETPDRIDAIVVAADDDNVAAVVAIAHKNLVPVVLLAENKAASRSTGKLGGLLAPSNQLADAVVIPGERLAPSWRDAGYATDRLHVIPPGIRVPQHRNPDTKRDARNALAKVVGDGQLNASCPLAVCQHPLTSASTFPSLLQAWKRVTLRRPDARLWIFGSGKDRAPLFDLIEQLELRNRVLLPGEVETDDDQFAAADVYIALAAGNSTPTFLLAAMANANAIVAADAPMHGQLITNNEHGLLLDTNDESELATAIERVLAQPALATALGSNARRRVKEHYLLEDRARRFASLVHDL